VTIISHGTSIKIREIGSIRTPGSFICSEDLLEQVKNTLYGAGYKSTDIIIKPYFGKIRKPEVLRSYLDKFGKDTIELSGQIGYKGRGF